MHEHPSIAIATNRFAWLWLAIALLIVVMCAARTSTIALDDDNYWLAYVAAGPTVQAKAIERQAAARAAADSRCVEESYRLSLRDRYGANYAGHAAVENAVDRTLVALDGGPRSTGTAIAALILTKVLVFLCIGLGLVWTAAGLKDQEKRIAVAGAIVALAAFDWLAHTGVVRVFGIYDVRYSLKAAAHLAYSFFVADEPHSLFGLTPRNAALGLLAIALTLKWNGKPVAASAAILATAALHQTYAGIALLFFGAASAVSRPATLKPLGVRLILVLCLLMALLRDRYGTEGAGPRVLAAAVLAAAVLAAFAFIQGAGYQRLRERLTGRFASDEILIDAAVIVVICIVVTLVALIFGRGAEHDVRLYFWSDLAIRIWSFARFPCFVAIALVLARRFARPSEAITVLTTGAVLLSIAIGLQINTRPEWSARGSLDSNLAAARDGRIDFEGSLYLHLLNLSIGAEAADRARQTISSLPMRCQPPPV
jgi:hypothetical protein